MLIGSPKLKSISISSFFPIRDYPYLRDKSMKGWEYVYKIDTWIDLETSYTPYYYRNTDKYGCCGQGL